MLFGQLCCCSRLHTLHRTRNKQLKPVSSLRANNALAKVKLGSDGSSDDWWLLDGGRSTHILLDTHLKWGTLLTLLCTSIYSIFGLMRFATRWNKCKLNEASRIIADWNNSFARHRFLSVLTRVNLTHVSTNHISPHCYSCAWQLPRRGHLSFFIIIVTFRCLPVVPLSFHYLLYRMQLAQFRSHDCNCAQL